MKKEEVKEKYITTFKTLNLSLFANVEKLL